MFLSADNTRWLDRQVRHLAGGQTQWGLWRNVVCKVGQRPPWTMSLIPSPRHRSCSNRRNFHAARQGMFKGFFDLAVIRLFKTSASGRGSWPGLSSAPFLRLSFLTVSLSHSIWTTSNRHKFINLKSLISLFHITKEVLPLVTSLLWATRVFWCCRRQKKS